MVRQNYLYLQERFILLEIRERIQNKYIEKKDHFTLTQLPDFIAVLAAAAIAALFFSLLSSHSHNPSALSRLCLHLYKKEKSTRLSWLKRRGWLMMNEKKCLQFGNVDNLLHGSILSSLFDKSFPSIPSLV